MTDAYKIGITVALHNVIGSELTRIATEFSKADKAAMGLAGSVKLLGAAVAVGFVAAMVAGVDEARKFQLELAKFDQLGFGDQTNRQAAEFAKGMKTLGTSATQNMALVTDAMAVFKNLDHAEMVAPLMAKMKFVNHALYGDQGGERDAKLMDMLKVIEFRGGLNSDTEFATQANFVQQVINGSRNRVDGSALLQALKTGGVALSRRDNDAFYLGSEPLIQEFGGSRYGTAAMSAYQNLIMLRTTQRAMTEEMRLGLLDRSKVEFNPFTGKVKSARPGALRGSDILEHEGELAFLEKVLLPAFAAKGITGDDAIVREIGTLFTNRTASGLFARIYQQRGSLHNQIDANRSANDIGKSVSEADKTLDGKLVELTAQWANLLRHLGDDVLPGVIWGVGKLTDALSLINSMFGHGPVVYEKQTAGDSWSKAVAAWKGWFSSSDTKAPAQGSFVPPRQQQPFIVNSSVVLDGQVVAKSTSRLFGDYLNSTASSASGPRAFDPRMSLAPAGGG